MMEECMMKRRQVPAFGYWDYCDELPVTHYFELQAGLIRGHYYGDHEHEGVFSAPTHTAPAYQHHHRKAKKVGNATGDHKPYAKEQKGKQVRVVADLKQQATPRRSRASKAVDEDLYKIPPELLCQKPKRKRSLKNLWSGCMGLNSGRLRS
ncbi:uncharacterized protein LOC122022506 [Zingiber officinale]|uniref:Uncharacterized protein n=1 Tax=Zingiber officinale TaxID=94328 RepID=A0A8J5F188_ZINOF|nr:uncharacterized protein LOC122022506 [Zingiber officinale]KAG6476997.1 hypothetical protein ZIOFF_066247 [Zingiber officinale]